MAARNFIRRFCTVRTPTAHRYNIPRRQFNVISDADLYTFETLVGKSNVLTEDIEQFNVDWLRNYEGLSKVVVLPESTEEVSSILKHCYKNNLAVCPQGGNTGLVGGSVPVHDEIILSLKRMNKIMDFDSVTGILSCEAGCILQNLDEFVGAYDHMVPIDLGARGSCMIGGNLATSAAGIRLVRYGSLHAHTLGMEVVLADDDGTVLNCMSNLRKDNTGFHLPHIFIGSEGALGVITKAVISCPSRPSHSHLAFLGCDSFEACIGCLKSAKLNLAEVLNSFEMMDAESLNVVVQNLGASPVLDTSHPFYLLVEVAGSNSNHDSEKLDHFLKDVMSKGFVQSGTVAADSKQHQAMWNLRETITEACQHDGYTYKYDISLQLDDYYNIVSESRIEFEKYIVRCVGFGHFADGNLHLNVTAKEYDPDLYERLNDFVFKWTTNRKGSISAEHGIGFMKRKALPLNKNETAINEMKKLKHSFDPKGILNPYKIFLN